MGNNPSETSPTEHLVTSEENGMRLDRLARRLFGKRPLTWVYQQIRTGHLKVDGKKRRQNYRLKEGQLLTLPAPPAKRERIQFKGSWTAEEPEILMENDDFLVLIKPAGLAVQGGLGTGAENVVAWLARRYPDAEYVPAPAHRIDRETSGLILCAKKASVARKLLHLFKDQRVHKDYLALVQGKLTEPQIIDAPLEKQSRKGFSKMEVREGGQASATEIVPLMDVEDLTLVLARPRTGRTHQIRVHLAHAGHPLAGDSRYGGDPHSELALGENAFFLHAWRLQIPSLAAQDELLTFEAPLSQEFRKALGRLGIEEEAALAKARRL